MAKIVYLNHNFCEIKKYVHDQNKPFKKYIEILSVPFVYFTLLTLIGRSFQTSSHRPEVY